MSSRAKRGCGCGCFSFLIMLFLLIGSIIYGGSYLKGYFNNVNIRIIQNNIEIGNISYSYIKNQKENLYVNVAGIQKTIDLRSFEKLNDNISYPETLNPDDLANNIANQIKYFNGFSLDYWDRTLNNVTKLLNNNSLENLQVISEFKISRFNITTKYSNIVVDCMDNNKNLVLKLDISLRRNN